MLGQVSVDDMLRTKIRMQEKAQRDYNGRINYALNEGMEKGIERGRQEGREEGLQEGIEKGIKELIFTLVDLGIDEESILKRLQKSYVLSPEKARIFYEKYCITC